MNLWMKYILKERIGHPNLFFGCEYDNEIIEDLLKVILSNVEPEIVKLSPSPDNYPCAIFFR